MAGGAVPAVRTAAGRGLRHRYGRQCRLPSGRGHQRLLNPDERADPALGSPLALYTDRHGVFKFNGRPRHIPGPVESTNFTRAIRELGVQRIFTRSPQAKDRVERATGTFQDRLVTELRLAKASTIQQANEILERFIPRFNAKFAVKSE